jgi:ribosome-associated protein
MKPRDNTIKLNQFLKLMGIVPTGGQAKLMIQGGNVKLNGEVETRRGRRLVPGDQVTVEGKTFEVNLNNSEDQDPVTVLPEEN